MEDKIIIKYIKNKKEEGLRLLIEKYGDYINTIVRNNLKDLSYYQEECMNDILLSINTEIYIHQLSSQKQIYNTINKIIANADLPTKLILESKNN